MLQIRKIFKNECKSISLRNIYWSRKLFYNRKRVLVKSQLWRVFRFYKLCGAGIIRRMDCQTQLKHQCGWGVKSDLRRGWLRIEIIVCRNTLWNLVWLLTDKLVFRLWQGTFRWRISNSLCHSMWDVIIWRFRFKNYY